MQSASPERASLAEREVRRRGADETRAASVWLVLALVIEQPTHGYELIQRYQRRFGDYLPLSVPRVYGALDRLRDTGMIEPVAVRGRKSAPKQHRMRRSYRATEAGVEAYRSWVAERMRDDPHRHALLGRIASTGLRGIDGLLEVIDRCQRECMEELRSLPADSEQVEAGRASLDELAEALVADQRRRELRARHDWAVHARRVLEAQKKHMDAHEEPALGDAAEPVRGTR